jgi:heat shock protein HtpX
MRRWKSDRGLEARMFLTMFLLAMVYLVFLAVLLAMDTSQTVIILFMAGFMFLAVFLF